MLMFLVSLTTVVAYTTPENRQYRNIVVPHIGDPVAAKEEEAAGPAAKGEDPPVLAAKGGPAEDAPAKGAAKGEAAPAAKGDAKKATSSSGTSSMSGVSDEAGCARSGKTRGKRRRAAAAAKEADQYADADSYYTGASTASDAESSGGGGDSRSSSNKSRKASKGVKGEGRSGAARSGCGVPDREYPPADTFVAKSAANSVGGDGKAAKSGKAAAATSGSDSRSAGGSTKGVKGAKSGVSGSRSKKSASTSRSGNKGKKSGSKITKSATSAMSGESSEDYYSSEYPPAGAMSSGGAASDASSKGSAKGEAGAPVESAQDSASAKGAGGPTSGGPVDPTNTVNSSSNYLKAEEKSKAPISASMAMLAFVVVALAAMFGLRRRKQNKAKSLDKGLEDATLVLPNESELVGDEFDLDLEYENDPVNARSADGMFILDDLRNIDALSLDGRSELSRSGRSRSFGRGNRHSSFDTRKVRTTCC